MIANFRNEDPHELSKALLAMELSDKEHSEDHVQYTAIYLPIDRFLMFRLVVVGFQTKILLICHCMASTPSTLQLRTFFGESNEPTAVKTDALYPTRGT